MESSFGNRKCIKFYTFYFLFNHICDQDAHDF